MAAEKRSFSPDDIGTKSKDYHGTAYFVRGFPDGVKSLNLAVPFEEALKLALALQSCVQSLNRYDRGSPKGKTMGLLLSIKKRGNSIAVIEAPVRPADPKAQWSRPEPSMGV